MNRVLRSVRDSQTEWIVRKVRKKNRDECPVTASDFSEVPPFAEKSTNYAENNGRIHCLGESFRVGNSIKID